MTQAEYSTRIVVRRPVDAADFNGTVVVEWLNVSSGADAAAEYTYLADEVLRSGYAWVGVSAQRIGIEGGPIAVPVPNAEGRGLGVGIRNIDPERYGDLHHPGDAYSYDIYTQAAQALRIARRHRSARRARRRTGARSRRVAGRRRPDHLCERRPAADR